MSSFRYSSLETSTEKYNDPVGKYLFITAIETLTNAVGKQKIKGESIRTLRIMI